MLLGELSTGLLAFGTMNPKRAVCAKSERVIRPGQQSCTWRGVQPHSPSWGKCASDAPIGPAAIEEQGRADTPFGLALAEALIDLLLQHPARYGQQDVGGFCLTIRRSSGRSCRSSPSEPPRPLAARLSVEGRVAVE
jgi:hypothetical protein